MHLCDGRRQKVPSVFFFNDPATTEIYTLSLHDALPISGSRIASWVTPTIATTLPRRRKRPRSAAASILAWRRSEEHTSELQSRLHLVCRLLLDKNKKRSPLKLASASTMISSIAAETAIA